MNQAALFLRFRHLSKYSKPAQTLCTRVEAVQNDTISIPKRIPRGPTDILRALESTITRDPTAAHYKYHDDPYMMPSSNLHKRMFALAKESGKKAAHWVRSEHADLFQHKHSDPPIEIFFPKMIYNEKSDVTEEDLTRLINNALVSDATLVYKLLKEKGVELSNETRQSFLDLLCFFNHEDTISPEFIEERWYKQSMTKEKSRKTWKDGDLAEELFIGIENANAQTYSSLIQGMAKFYQVDRAWQLFEEAQTKQLVLSVDAFNAIIRVANFLKESYDMRWSLIQDILVMMHAQKVRPDLDTLNAVLEMVSTMGVARKNKEMALRTLSEFKSLGIEPSLASWYYLLITYCKDRGPVSYILKDILPHIENCEHEIRHIMDTSFFATAMDVCANHLHDRELAARVNNLLHFGNNFDLIGSSFRESVYYRHYFMLMNDTMPFAEFMSEVYEKLVPHIYVPEPTVMGEILKNVETYGAIEYLPKLWSDMVIFDHNDRENLVMIVLDTMTSNKPTDPLLLAHFGTIAWDVWQKVMNSQDRRRQSTFTGDMLGKIMTICLWNNDFEKACMVMNLLDKDLHTVVGVPKIEAMSLFIDHCILEKTPSAAINCIQYCNDNGFTETEEFATRLQNALTLDPSDLDRLGKLVGEHLVPKPVQVDPAEVIKMNRMNRLRSRGQRKE